MIDECHRGSAAADSNWRQVLGYFSSAIQVGLTATPKETKYVSNIDYFGEPVYIYPLCRGIEDGFLAPFKVVRVSLDIDVDGWRPDVGEVDDEGELIEDRVYNLLDTDRSIRFEQRTRLVAEYVSAFLQDGDPMRKTIVFCENIDHAQRMRQALANVEANRELVRQDARYVMQNTGDEKEGKAQLDNFINPNRAYPVIATTSKLMTTGVDAQTCHVIVLERRIQSMTEFKQIIGRGTRLKTDYGKHFFTIIDFRGATSLFRDDDWDGPPFQEDEFGALTGGEGDRTPDLSSLEETETEAPVKYAVGRQAFAVVREQVSYYDKGGKLTPEALRADTRRAVSDRYKSLDQFLRWWQAAARKTAIIEELQEQGVALGALQDMVGEGYDAFDLICYVAFDQPPLTRRERAENVKKRDVFTKYGETARQVLEALLDKYADQGVASIEDTKVLQLDPFAQMGTSVELVKSFGGKRQYRAALRDLAEGLYGDESA